MSNVLRISGSRVTLNLKGGQYLGFKTNEIRHTGCRNGMEWGACHPLVT